MPPWLTKISKFMHRLDGCLTVLIVLLLIIPIVLRLLINGLIIPEFLELDGLRVEALNYTDTTIQGRDWEMADEDGPRLLSLHASYTPLSLLAKRLNAVNADVLISPGLLAQVDGESITREAGKAAIALLHPQAEVDIDLAWQDGDTITASLSNGKELTEQLSGLPIDLSVTASGTLDGETFAGTANLEIPEFPDVHSANPALRASMPLQWPLPDSGLVATVKLARLQYGHWQVGPAEFPIAISANGASFKGSIPLLDSLQMEVDGAAGTNGMWHISGQLPLKAADSALEIRETPSIGTATVLGDMGFQAHGQQDTLELSLSFEGDLELPELELKAETMKLGFAIEQPGPIRSKPKQNISIKKLTMGGTLLANLNMDYQLEPEGAFFIEQLSFDWCGGRVRLHNCRISPAATQFAFQCNGIDLEKLLRQFGMDKAAIDGEVNGQLPIQWDGKKANIERGFLYSTPGNGGAIHFAEAKMVTAMLPEGSVQGGQVGLVSEALADFEYDWITLRLNTEGDNLILNVETLGKPRNPLPYQYDAKSESFIHIKMKPDRGIKDPMHLNLNFTIPLTKLIWYGGGVFKTWNRLTNPTGGEQ